MNRINLARFGPQISPLGLGCFARSGAYGSADPGEATPTIRRAVELICNFLDTADIYGGGEVERTVVSAIKDCRQDVVLASKFGFVCEPADQ